MISVVLQTPAELCRAVARAAEGRRVALRLTQQDLAAAAGVSLGTWKKFVRTGQGSLRMVAAVAQALRCPGSLADLFPAPEVRSLDEVLRQPTPRKRVRHEGQRTERTP